MREMPEYALRLLNDSPTSETVTVVATKLRPQKSITTTSCQKCHLYRYRLSTVDRIICQHH
jgi:hypothetical protein